MKATSVAAGHSPTRNLQHFQFSSLNEALPAVMAYEVNGRGSFNFSVRHHCV